MKTLKITFLLFLFTVGISQIMAQEVTIFPGFWSPEYYQDDTKISKKDLEALLAKNDEVLSHWKKAKTQEAVFGIATLAEVGLLVWGYSELLDDNRPRNERANRAVGPIAGSLGALIIGAIYLNKANQSKKNAILTYNKQFDEKTAFRVAPIGNQNGLGLALRF